VLGCGCDEARACGLTSSTPRDATKYGVFEETCPRLEGSDPEAGDKPSGRATSALEWSRWRWQCDVMAEGGRVWLSDPGEVDAEIPRRLRD